MELQILHWFESLHNPVLNPIVFGITKLGDKGILWIAIAVLMLLVLPKKYKKIGLTIVFALIFSLIMCNGVMKNYWHRIRPFNVDQTFENLYGIFGTIHDWSFPSGHTSASFAAAVAIFMWSKREGIAALVVAALISLSRLYLTVHYPTDVLASLILGAVYGVLAYLLVKFLMKRLPKFNHIFGGEETSK